MTASDSRTAARLADLAARPVLSLSEAAELVGCSTASIRRAADAGQVRSRKLGRRRYIETSSLLDFGAPSPGGAS